MAIVEWREEMSVNNTLIDMQHKHLIGIINRLGEAMQQGKANVVLGGLIDELVSYTVKHFRDEERLFAASAYPHTDKHREKHVALVAKVEEFQKGFAAGRASMSISVLNFLKDWLTEHIMKTDKTYMPYL